MRTVPALLSPAYRPVHEFPIMDSHTILNMPLSTLSGGKDRALRSRAELTVVLAMMHNGGQRYRFDCVGL